MVKAWSKIVQIVKELSNNGQKWSKMVARIAVFQQHRCTYECPVVFSPSPSERPRRTPKRPRPRSRGRGDGRAGSAHGASRAWGDDDHPCTRRAGEIGDAHARTCVRLHVLVWVCFCVCVRFLQKRLCSPFFWCLFLPFFAFSAPCLLPLFCSMGFQALYLQHFCVLKSTMSAMVPHTLLDMFEQARLAWPRRCSLRSRVAFSLLVDSVLSKPI